MKFEKKHPDYFGQSDAMIQRLGILGNLGGLLRMGANTPQWKKFEKKNNPKGKGMFTDKPLWNLERNKK